MRPILFNTEMVRAILDGRKIVTRRIMKPLPELLDGETMTPVIQDDGNWTFQIHPWTNYYDGEARAPCYKGDILYVRETWCKGRVDYGEEPDGRSVPFISQCQGEDDIIPKEWAIRNDIGIEDVVWRPSIFMPKEAARIFLRVKDVRAERLNDMQEEDAIAEGFPDLGVDADSPLERFSVLWDKTIKRDQIGEYGWYANPWVFVIEFERVSKEEATK